MKKVNLVEILKNCPSGMELDCAMWGNVVLDHIIEGERYPIHIKKKDGGIEDLTENGCFDFDSGAKCIIFPKGTDTWEGFVPPCKFKDGDIVSFSIFPECTWIGIFKQYEENGKTFETYCTLNGIGEINGLCLKRHSLEGTHLATEKEKQRLFKAIEDNGYKWNAETKTLERIIKPKFKVGDRIKHVVGREEVATVVGVKETYYILESKVGTSAFTISLQYEWELVSKFDISTLNPFDKVLVRNSNDLDWACDLFSHLRHEDSLLNRFRCIDMSYKYCIPFKGNEHLCGTSEDCDEFYKTWEE